jgi:flagellin
MQQLAVEGANGSLSNTQRAAIVTELSNLNTQINSFAEGTTYNNIQLLANNAGTRTAGSASVGLAITTLGSVSSLDVSNAAGGVYTFTAATLSATSASITLSDGTRSQSLIIGDLSAAANQTLTFSNLGITVTSQLTHAAATATLTASGFNTKTITVAGGNVASLGFQIGASPTAGGDSISISTINISTLDSNFSSMKSTGYAIVNNYDSTGLTFLSTSTTATDALWNTAFKALQGYVTTAINDISSSRATLGANMNQLGFINQTLQAQSANEQAARSTIVDTNFSAETARLTKGQIMQQAATAMLAQANQMPNVILSLLK